MTELELLFFVHFLFCCSFGRCSVRLKELTHEWSVRSLSYETLIAKYIGDQTEFASPEDILNVPQKQVVPRVTKVKPVVQL